MPEGGHIDEVGIGGMDTDAADVAACLKTAVRPGDAGVGRAVDAVTVGDVGANAALAHPGIDDVGVRRGDGQRTHRCSLEEAVGHVPPAQTSIDRLPDAPARRAEVERSRFAGITGDGHDAPATKGPDQPPVKPAEEPLRGRCLGVRHADLLPTDVRRLRLAAPRAWTTTLPREVGGVPGEAGGGGPAKSGSTRRSRGSTRRSRGRGAREVGGVPGEAGGGWVSAPARRPKPRHETAPLWPFPLPGTVL